jgi:hypothetical protein
MLASWRCPPRRGLLALASLALAGALAFPPSLAASIVIPATLDELAIEAHLIVHARVARVETRQAPGTLRVERVVSLDVLRALKGSPEARVVVVLPGGTYGRYRTVVPGVPDVSDGEEAVLFLRASAAGTPQLVGLTQGFLRVRVDGETGQRTVAAPVVAGTDGPVVRGATDRGPQPLARIEARIAHVVLAQLRGRR